MKLIGAALCVLVLLTAGASAQTKTTTYTIEDKHDKTEVKQKIEIKDGTDVKVMGCLERNPGGGFMLTHVPTAGMRYALVTDDNLSKYLDHRVMVTGKATDLGKGKVKIESKVKSDREAVATTGELTTKTETKGGVKLPYLGVSSIKSVADSCR
jgi:hypothetical protein